MKPYSAQNHLPITGLIMLMIGSIVLGIAVGAMAYFISNFIYFLVLFPLIIGGIVMIAYYRLLEFTKVRHPWLAALIGLTTGLFVAAAFYATPYFVLRHNVVADAQQKHNMDATTASNGLDASLIRETGSSGFWGFMKLRAIEGDQYTNYVMVNSLPVGKFDFTLKSPWAWIYWILEVLLLTLPVAWIGLDVGKRAFSQTANDWYNPLPKQIGSASLESKEELLALLHTQDLLRISEFLVAEGELPHPVLEIYEQRSNNKKGDILLSVKQTFLDSRSRVKRNTLGQWEISQQEYAAFIDAVNRHLAA